MESEDIFLGVVVILLLFNFVLIFMQPETASEIVLDRIIGFVAGIVAIGILSGITVLGTGLGTQSVKIIFGLGAILNILFRIETPYFNVGLGLASDLVAQFNAGEGLGIGYFIATILSIGAIISGLIIINNN